MNSFTRYLTSIIHHNVLQRFIHFLSLILNIQRCSTINYQIYKSKIMLKCGFSWIINLIIYVILFNNVWNLYLIYCSIPFIWTCRTTNTYVLNIPRSYNNSSRSHKWIQWVEVYLIEQWVKCCINKRSATWS